MMATEDNQLSAHDPEWQRYAVRLASLRVSFGVVGLNQLDHSFCEIIKEKFNLNATFDIKAGSVHFKPMIIE